MAPKDCLGNAVHSNSVAPAFAAVSELLGETVSIGTLVLRSRPKFAGSGNRVLPRSPLLPSNPSTGSNRDHFLQDDFTGTNPAVEPDSFRSRPSGQNDLHGC
jgi:hypothetical protein